MPSDTQPTQDPVEQLEPLAEARQRLTEEGFTHEFTLRDDVVVHTESGVHHRPEDVEIVSTHRNEGETDPGDESVLFALQAPDGVRGVLVTNYGHDAPHADAIRRLGQAARANS